jgi:hypothetical protein
MISKSQAWHPVIAKLYLLLKRMKRRIFTVKLPTPRPCVCRSRVCQPPGVACLRSPSFHTSVRCVSSFALPPARTPPSSPPPYRCPLSLDLRRDSAPRTFLLLFFSQLAPPRLLLRAPIPPPSHLPVGSASAPASMAVVLASTVVAPGVGWDQSSVWGGSQMPAMGTGSAKASRAAPPPKLQRRCQLDIASLCRCSRRIDAVACPLPPCATTPDPRRRSLRTLMAPPLLLLFAIPTP